MCAAGACVPSGSVPSAQTARLPASGGPLLGDWRLSLTKCLWPQELGGGCRTPNTGRPHVTGTQAGDRFLPLGPWLFVWEMDGTRSEPGLPLALGPVLSVQRSGLTSCVHCCDSRLGSPQTPPLGRQCRAGRHGHRPALSAGLSRAVPNSVCPSGFLSAWKGGREAFGHLLSAVPCPPWPVPSTSSSWVRMWRVWCLITCGHGSVLDEEATARAGPGPCCQVILQAPGKRLRPFCHLPRQKPVRLT